MNLFFQKCTGCGEQHMGPRENGKAKGRWLGYDKCPPCREKEAAQQKESEE